MPGLVTATVRFILYEVNQNESDVYEKNTNLLACRQWCLIFVCDSAVVATNFNSDADHIHFTTRSKYYAQCMVSHKKKWKSLMVLIL